MASLALGALGAPWAPMARITEDEARGLTAALVGVAEHYDLRPNPKVVAWVNLAGVLAVTYGGRYMAYQAMRAQAQANAAPAFEEPTAGVTIDVPPAGGVQSSVAFG